MGGPAAALVAMVRVPPPPPPLLPAMTVHGVAVSVEKEAGDDEEERQDDADDDADGGGGGAVAAGAGRGVSVVRSPPSGVDGGGWGGFAEIHPMIGVLCRKEGVRTLGSGNYNDELWSLCDYVKDSKRTCLRS